MQSGITPYEKDLKESTNKAQSNFCIGNLTKCHKESKWAVRLIYMYVKVFVH